ncbi:MAG TPA: hydrogenase expression/formation protein HypE [Deltaproteobacteria bacterium]|jgi:hydrogenase expression/formation protein HypE|nr:hydrogenase expression/formation protein HypE [Deltaproteobacteria bacterium]HOI08629.1 hydrogenase expression/formation protein HypE [Deltaproteobacteria bacterium]
MRYDEILLAHGSGGRLTSDLIGAKFLPHLRNDCLEALGDSAVFSIGGTKLCFTTDSYVVNPVFFPGGNIGSLAVHGTVNDLSVCGGRPLFMSAGFILEEGFPMRDLEAIVESMGSAAREAGVQIVTGDTKVVAKGSADRIFINTSGLGVIEYEGELSVGSIREGDVLIVSGTIGDHGAAILSAREELGLASGLVSDCASLNGLIHGVLGVSPHVHFMRDATRGGLGAVVCEAAAGAGARIELKEASIPVKEEVRGLCEILGLDPLYIANEGKLVLFCPAAEAGRVLSFMQGHPLGRDAAVIGEVTAMGGKRVILHTSVGGSREIDMPVGELIPRIC